MTSIDRLFEAHLIVADLDASIAFYRTVSDSNWRMWYPRVEPRFSGSVREATRCWGSGKPAQVL